MQIGQQPVRGRAGDRHRDDRGARQGGGRQLVEEELEQAGVAGLVDRCADDEDVAGADLDDGALEAVVRRFDAVAVELGEVDRGGVPRGVESVGDRPRKRLGC